MPIVSLARFLTTALLLTGTSVKADIYHLGDNFRGPSFYSGFGFEAIPDPTHGRVTYVDQQTAQAQNLTFASRDTFIIRTDFTTALNATDPGRNSVRIKSLKTYTTHVEVFDIRHMPQGCATWPAAWTVMEDGWPAGGEIDIIEGVNDETPNHSTLHTTPGCTMPSNITDQSGATVSTDCDTNANFNQGCSVAIAGNDSYGPPFNANGGGWYAMERTNEFVKIWFWSRKGYVPEDVRHGGRTVNTSKWGIPSAFFPSNDTCDLESKMAAHNIIINLTLCGDFAGQAQFFNGAGCPGDCDTFVDENPSAFVDAYWDIASLRTYQ